jgi:NAD(P)-dependent dehydrogenase (short-subunit alcohol dehydrogenase family)
LSEPPIALVSGANRGIGLEVARQLAAGGHRVLLGSRDRTAGERAAAGIESGDVEAIELDVADAGSVERAAARISADPGRLDVLVNNAAVFGSSAGAGYTDLSEAHDVLETNVFGAWRLTGALLPMLRSSPHGRIVNVSSGGGQLAEMGGGRAAYRVSKTALNALTRVLAADEAGSGILVNSLCPGWVRTRMGGESASRSVEEGADTAVWLATLPDEGPTGGFFRDREPIPW